MKLAKIYSNSSSIHIFKRYKTGLLAPFDLVEPKIYKYNHLEALLAYLYPDQPLRNSSNVISFLSVFSALYHSIKKFERGILQANS